MTQVFDVEPIMDSVEVKIGKISYFFSAETIDAIASNNEELLTAARLLGFKKRELMGKTNVVSLNELLLVESFLGQITLFLRRIADRE